MHKKEGLALLKVQFIKYKQFKHLFRDYNTVYLKSTTTNNTKKPNYRETDIEIKH